MDFYLQTPRKKYWVKNLKCTGTEYSDTFDKAEEEKKISKLEEKYGALNWEADETKTGWKWGFSHDESISKTDAEALIEEFKQLFKSLGWL